MWVGRRSWVMLPYKPHTAYGHWRITEKPKTKYEPIFTIFSSSNCVPSKDFLCQKNRNRIQTEPLIRQTFHHANRMTFQEKQASVYFRCGFWSNRMLGLRTLLLIFYINRTNEQSMCCVIYGLGTMFRFHPMFIISGQNENWTRRWPTHVSNLPIYDFNWKQNALNVYVKEAP